MISLVPALKGKSRLVSSGNRGMTEISGHEDGLKDTRGTYVRGAPTEIEKGLLFVPFRGRISREKRANKK
jgi:hypothetical protein